MGINVKGYWDTINAPWGRIFYDLAWHNLEFQGLRILDFGSGFGKTADFLAKNNTVLAIEPNEEMLEYRFCENDYEQIVGGIEAIKDFDDNSFDVVLCHNVMEYLENREELISEFKRVLKDGGILSVIKHNKAGKIMQKAVFEYKIDEALSLIEGNDVASVNFGTINEYELSDLERFCHDKFIIDKVYGLRMFYALQRNEFKTEEDWIDKMYELECRAEEIQEFRDIAFFHHVILKKV